ncbi:gp5 [Synechococcus phage Syn5]|uniref:Gp5 n=1 Tax=Synechococcus phage Syn5 TaxID=2914003 RepID=A4ZR86_9CAUD|nr:gp5 [Synechococcus phage Syn5]ABP87912.1 gp5 [Synechococcus phage Syn5]
MDRIQPQALTLYTGVNHTQDHENWKRRPDRRPLQESQAQGRTPQVLGEAGTVRHPNQDTPNPSTPLPMIKANGRKAGKQYSSLFNSKRRPKQRRVIDPQVAEQRIAQRLAHLGF